VVLDAELMLEASDDEAHRRLEATSVDVLDLLAYARQYAADAARRSGPALIERALSKVAADAAHIAFGGHPSEALQLLKDLVLQHRRDLLFGAVDVVENLLDVGHRTGQPARRELARESQRLVGRVLARLHVVRQLCDRGVEIEGDHALRVAEVRDRHVDGTGDDGVDVGELDERFADEQLTCEIPQWEGLEARLRRGHPRVEGVDGLFDDVDSVRQSQAVVSKTVSEGFEQVEEAAAIPHRFEPVDGRGRDEAGEALSRTIEQCDGPLCVDVVGRDQVRLDIVERLTDLADGPCRHWSQVVEEGVDDLDLGLGDAAERDVFQIDDVEHREQTAGVSDGDDMPAL